MICILFEGKTREIDIFLKENNLRVPYLGSPIYSSQVAVVPNVTLEIISWGIYVFVSSFSQTWISNKYPQPLGFSAVNVEVLQHDINSVKMKIKHGKNSKTVRLKYRTKL